MKVYIDVSVLTMAAFLTGIQRVTREITLRLVADPAVEAVLLYYHATRDSYYRIDHKAYFRYYAGHAGIKERMVTKQKVPLSDIGYGAVFFDLDAAWMCRAKRSYLLPILKKQGAAIVAQVYDIISVTHPQYCLQRGVCFFMDYIGAHLQYADAIIVNAQATAAELNKLSGQAGCELPSCTVIPLGADFQSEKQIQKKQIRKSLFAAVKGCMPYLLMAGTIEPRKNHRLLLRAYDEGLRDMGYSIMFAGSMGWDMEVFEQDMKRHPDYGKRIFWFSGLRDDEISYLYRHAQFLVFCSYTEGFGLPVVEALQRGTPVLAADLPVTREAAGDACIYFAQDDARQICSRVFYYKNNKEAYARLRQRIREYHPGSWNTCYCRMRQALCQAQRDIGAVQGDAGMDAKNG
ncbi:MAG: glycosyltransferase family 4 protein [Eubacterium sp.]|nr:glycosyltransferase family 4 protein [Eubacterium sp.]